MNFNYWVFDENSIIAKFKYYDDAIAFVYSLISDLDSDISGFDIYDVNKAAVIDFNKIKKIILAYDSI